MGQQVNASTLRKRQRSQPKQTGKKLMHQVKMLVKWLTCFCSGMVVCLWWEKCAHLVYRLLIYFKISRFSCKTVKYEHSFLFYFLCSRFVLVWIFITFCIHTVREHSKIITCSKTLIEVRV